MFGSLDNGMNNNIHQKRTGNPIIGDMGKSKKKKRKFMRTFSTFYTMDIIINNNKKK